MPSFPAINYIGEVISPWTHHSLSALAVAALFAQPSSSSFPVANTAFFIPFRLRERSKITQIVIGGGGTSGGNFDVGIYDKFGNRIVSGGSTAKTASAENVVNITDVLLGRGVYYMAFAADSTTNYIGSVPTTVAKLKIGGVKEMASAFPLPDPATLATITNPFLPLMALYRTSL